MTDKISQSHEMSAVLERAREAGLDEDIITMNPKELRAFANLIRADEREQCANLCKRYVLAKFPAASIEAAIRERGE